MRKLTPLTTNNRGRKIMKRLLKKTTQLVALSLTLGLLVIPSIAQAAGVLGGNLSVQNDGDVIVTFGGSDAGYTSTLYLGETAIFSNQAAAGSTVNLGNFAAGTELNFRLEVQNTGNVFFTGAGANNIDGIAHATVENIGTNLTQVGFEDLLGGGDKDYNDLVFQFSNTETAAIVHQGKLLTNPEPATIILFGTGLLGLGAWRLRKKHA